MTAAQKQENQTVLVHRSWLFPSSCDPNDTQRQSRKNNRPTERQVGGRCPGGKLGRAQSASWSCTRHSWSGSAFKETRVATPPECSLGFLKGVRRVGPRGSTTVREP